jgi:hypothetical protein
MTQKTKSYGIYNYPNRPMPLLDGRLVSYYTSDNLLVWFSIPMTEVKYVGYFKEYDDRVLIEYKDETFNILFFGNNEDASTEYKFLIDLQQKWYGKTYNYNDISMP